MEKFDVAVIGAGPGGYVAAIKLSQLGLKVACIEKRGSLGGTCLNVGCIPSKSLLDSTYKYYAAKNKFAEFGVNCGEVTFDLKKMLSSKDKIVSDLSLGIEGLFKKNKVTYIKGYASFKSKNLIEITQANAKQSEQKFEIEAGKVIIATGSEVVNITGVEIDEEIIVSSTGALNLKSVPRKMLIIGGGYIGLEMASVWNRLGADVEVIEYAERVTPAMDKEISFALQRSLEKQGIKFRLSTKLVSATKSANQAKIIIEPASGGSKEELICETLLIAVGRKPNTQNLGLEKIGIKLDERGRIEVDQNFATNISGVFAIGDVIRGPMLAHKSEEEGFAVAEIISGQAGHVNYNTIPAVIYTHPEVASVGKTEEELKQAGVSYNCGKFPFLANSRARAISDTEGFTKILACSKTDEIFGVHIIGPDAGTIIAQVVVAMEYKASSEDLARCSHAHPTLNEGVKEAALATFSKPIHI